MTLYEMTNHVTYDAIASAIGSVEVRTRTGGWREVVSLYSDATVGTIRAEGNSAGTYRVQPLGRFGEMRVAR